ncbi:MAG: hypothetical protein IT562_16575 [Alphaproteobacteria bacterium]|nr:hypothetical protein [Alphaproteobacteria bacterium]
MTTISRVYDSWDQAQSAVRALQADGTPASEISVVANKYIDDRYANARPVEADEPSATGIGTGTGAAVGGGVGLLTGLGLMAIPGLGPVVAAGWLASTAAGAAAGAATGGIVGALVDSGEDDTTANVYAESVRRGGTMVTVRTDESRRSDVEQVLNRYQPVDYKSRAAEYGAGGWRAFDESAGPYQPNASEVERIRRKWTDAA